MADDFESRVQRGLRAQAGQAQRPQDPADDVRRRVRRQDATRRSFVGAAAVVALAVLAGVSLPTLGADGIVFDSGPASSPTEDDASDSDGAEAEGTESDPADDDVAGADGGVSSCEGEQAGVTWSLDYPASWWSSVSCRFLHPEPTIPLDESAPTGTAISVDLDGRRTYRDVLEDSRSQEILSERETTVDGWPTTVHEIRITEDGALHGMRVYGYLVRLEDRTLVALTSDRDAGGDYERRRDTLDDVVASLEISVEELPDPVRCSAYGLSHEPTPQPGLPAEVAELRERLVSAAVACDYEMLAALAADGHSFNGSFGIDPPDDEDLDDDEARARAEAQERVATSELLRVWRHAEASGHEPLRFLVELLNRPHAFDEEAEPSLVVWPSAFAYDQWDDVPAEDRDALRPLYGDGRGDLAAFEDFAAVGSYYGYRVGITEDGEWSFFVTGD